MPEDNLLDLFRQMLTNQGKYKAPEATPGPDSQQQLHDLVNNTEPFHMFPKVGRLSEDEFGGLHPDMQEKYLEGLSQAESGPFMKVYSDWFAQHNPGAKGGGLTLEQIQNTLTPYRDRMRTGKPQR